MLKDRIKILMDALQVSNDTIASYAGYDSANISRMRSGARIPAAESPTLQKFANAVSAYAADCDKTELIEKITEQEPLAEWLCKDQTANPQKASHTPPGNIFFFWLQT